MALLLNRKYGSRLECLYYILKTTYDRFGDNEFKIKDLKYDQDEVNVFSHCELLLIRMGRKYCPFLNNPLNPSKCYATQSVDSDSTKLKAASDVARSFEALGFLSSNDSGFTITESGKQWIKTKMDSQEWLELVKSAVLSYGVVIGFLHKINSIDDPFNSSTIYLGYPDSDDPEELSSNSTRDSNTRTVSKIVSWCVTAGLIEPIQDFVESSNQLPQVKYKNFVNASILRVRLFKKTAIADDFFNIKHFVSHPLSYQHLNKNVGSIRERGSEDIRLRTLINNDKVLNRRFVFVYVLNEMSKLNRTLNFNDFVKTLLPYENTMFLPNSDITSIMQTEANIASICGIPFDIYEDELIPKTIIDEHALSSSAPNEIIQIANRIVKSLT